MADYRRANRPGGTFFFTIVTYGREPLLADPQNVDRLRTAVLAVMNEQPFEFLAGVVLPDHAHYLWTLPAGDTDFSRRIGRMKAQFTKSLPVGWAPPTDSLESGGQCPPYKSTSNRSPSRTKHRDADVWQRRFWEHVIRDDADLRRHLDYIHYNPVRHGLTSCPHAWPSSSFEWWIAKGCYDRDWCCACDGRMTSPPNFEWATADME